MDPKRPLAPPFWMKRSGWLFFAVAILVAFVGYGMDRLLMYLGIPRWDLLGLSDVATGIIAGCLFLYVARHEKAHREHMREQMRTVAELNHHIRNALQVIKLCGARTAAPAVEGRQLQLIKESADRIEWALREVLPRYPIEGAALRQPAIGFAAVPSPGAQLKAFSERRREDRAF